MIIKRKKKINYIYIYIPASSNKYKATSEKRKQANVLLYVLNNAK